MFFVRKSKVPAHRFVGSIFFSALALAAICQVVQQTTAKTKVQGYRIEDHGAGIEIVGVCKVSESAIGCWSPDGKPAEDLSTRVQSLMNSQATNDYYRTFQFQFNRKNRILVYRDIDQTRLSGILSYGEWRDSTGYYRNRIGWSGNMILFPGQEGNPSKSLRVVVGAFDLSAKTASYDYQISSGSKATKVPVKIGKTTVEGMEFEIEKIQEVQDQFNGFRSGISEDRKAKQTKLSIKVNANSDPNLYLYCQLCDDKGNPYVGLSPQGDPIDSRTRDRIYEEGRKVAQKPTVNQGQFPFVRYLPSFNIVRPNSDPPQSPEVIIPVSKDKVKFISVVPMRRTIYTVDNIRLDPLP